MEYNKLRENNKKLVSIIKPKYIKINYSKVEAILDNNLNEPRWMDTYVLIYKAMLKPDITIYNILLEKLSTPIFLLYYKDGNNRYLANADERMLKSYTNFLITGNSSEYYVNARYIPQKDYAKEILKISKFSECGMYLKHICDDKFGVEGTTMNFENISEAKKVYDELLDINDFYKNVNVEKSLIKSNYASALNLGKDKRMLATISNISTYFKCNFDILDDAICLHGFDMKIYNEETATSFQNRVIDAYHFFRNVINATDKKDIISEIYNGKLDKNIKTQFEENLASYMKAVQNKDLIDWIVTISKESKYTLNINYDDQGVFYINDAMIVTPLDAKEYYIDYMERKKEKLSITMYSNSFISKIKRVWTRIKAKFVKI